jgi:hypothetical protein
MAKEKDIAREFAKELLEDETYRANLKQRLQYGAVPAAVEVRLWDYLYGKPADKLEIKDDRAKLEGLSNEELVTYLEDLKNLAVMLRNQGQANGQEEK